MCLWWRHSRHVGKLMCPMPAPCSWPLQRAVFCSHKYTQPPGYKAPNTSFFSYSSWSTGVTFVKQALFLDATGQYYASVCGPGPRQIPLSLQSYNPTYSMQGEVGKFSSSHSMPVQLARQYLIQWYHALAIIQTARLKLQQPYLTL